MRHFLGFIALVINLTTSAQLDYSQYKGEVSVSSYSAITYRDEIMGYQVSLKVKNKKEDFLSINLLDKNADVLARMDIENGSQYYIVETAFNGNLFAILFLNMKDKKLETRMYTMKGQEVSKFERVLGDNDIRFFTSKISQASASLGANKYLHEIDSQGFFLMYTTQEENLYSCNVYKLDSNPKSERFYTYMTDVPIYDAKYLGRKDGQLYFSFEKKGKNPNAFTADIISVHMHSMDQAFEITQAAMAEKVFIPNSIIKGLEGKYPVIDGRFYQANHPMFNEYHDGVALWEVSPTGVVMNESYTYFQEDFKDLKFNQKNKSSEVGYLFPHKSIGTPEGKIFLISEGYKKVADAPGMMAPSFGMWGGYYYSAEYTRIKTSDLVITEFRQNLKYRSSGIFEKKSNTTELGFYEANSIYRIGDIFNRNGLFDFLFVENDIKRGHINVYFRDYSRSNSSGGLYKITKLTISKEDIHTHTFEKRPNTSETYFLPLSFGNLMIMEYISRKKTMYFDIRYFK